MLCLPELICSNLGERAVSGQACFVVNSNSTVIVQLPAALNSDFYPVRCFLSDSLSS